MNEKRVRLKKTSSVIYVCPPTCAFINLAMKTVGDNSWTYFMYYPRWVTSHAVGSLSRLIHPKGSKVGPPSLGTFVYKMGLGTWLKVGSGRHGPKCLLSDWKKAPHKFAFYGLLAFLGRSYFEWLVSLSRCSGQKTVVQPLLGRWGVWVVLWLKWLDCTTLESSAHVNTKAVWISSAQHILRQCYVMCSW